MAELPKRHPEVAKKFNNSKFDKTKQVFSGIPIDQANEQNNTLIKGNGRAVGLTGNPSTLQHWMTAEP